MIERFFRSYDNRTAISKALMLATCLWWQGANIAPAGAAAPTLKPPPPLPVVRPQAPAFHPPMPQSATPGAMVPLAPAFPGQVGKDYNECMRLAAGALQRGNYQSAADNYKEASRLKPNEPSPYLGLGHCFGAVGKDDEALEQYFGALTLKPDYWAVRFHIGNILMARQSWDEAAGQYMQILQSVPNDVSVRGNLALCYLQKGQLDTAIEQFKYIIQINPKNVEAWYNLGVANDLKGDWDSAAAAYRKTIELNPKHHLAYTQLGNCLMNKRDFKSALVVDKLAVSLDPNNYYSYICLGRVYECMEKYDEAKKNFDKAIHLNPKAPESQKLLHNMLKERANKLGISGLPGL